MSALAASLLEKIQSRRARAGVVGLGYVGLPLAVELAKAGFHATGIDLDDAQGPGGQQGRILHSRRLQRGRRSLRQADKLDATTDFSIVARARHDQHLRADAAAQDEGPRHVLHRLRGGGDCGAPPPGDAGRASSRRPIRARPTKSCSRCSRPPGSRRASISSSPSRPSASIRATRRSRRTTCRRSSAASRRRARQLAAGALRHGDRDDRPGQLHARRRDGEAAREHVPRGEHRPGQRARADVRPHGHRRLGSGRSGEDEAVRLHGLLPGPRPRRPLHPDRSVLPVVEGEAERASIRASSSSPATSTAACRTTSSTRSARR